MAAFGEFSETSREDFRLLQSGWVTLVHGQSVLDETIADLKGLAYRVDTLDCRGLLAVDFVERIAGVLEFPARYGRNLAAMRDCLSDLEFPRDSGRAVVILGFDHVVRWDAEFSEAVLDIFADAARGHMLFGRRLIVLVQSDDPRIEISIPAQRVDWNRREFLAERRGVSERDRDPPPGRMVVWYLGDCPGCGPEGELVLCKRQPGARPCIQCAECHMLWHDPVSVAHEVTEFVTDGSTWPMTWGEIERAGWTHLARRSMDMRPDEWPVPPA